MSQPRILRRNTASFYHVYSRIVDKQRIIREREKRYFHTWMRRLERFSGVQVVTYCLMSNHFHVLVRVPEKAQMPTLDEPTLRQLLPLIYSGRQLSDATRELDGASAAQDSGDSLWLREILNRYDARRHDLSSFIKDLKQRFSQGYNSHNARTGTLWEDKFHSVLVEGDENTLLTMAAYIDLNPIRANLVTDPRDYRWSGYGEANGGSSDARKGLAAILEHTSFASNRPVTWRSTGPRYRMLLYGHGERRDHDLQSGSVARPGLSREQIEAVLARGGELTAAQALRSRIRYFCDGAVMGTADFVDSVFEESVKRPTSKRKHGANRMKGADWGEIRVLRNLQTHIFGLDK